MSKKLLTVVASGLLAGAFALFGTGAGSGDATLAGELGGPCGQAAACWSQ